jgi:hypothetical protein
MVLNKLIISQIDDLYKPSGSFIFNYLIPIVIITVWLYNVIRMSIKIQLKAAKTDWSTNKCSPKYLFVSGLIQPNPGLGVVGSTRNNFNDCVLNVNK